MQVFQAAETERGAYVLSVGALHPLKGHDFLIDSLATIPADQRPPLLLVSDRVRERERSRLERRAGDGGVELRVRTRVSESEPARLYGQARLVLYAPYEEPFGLVPIEAMACGTPVLAVPEGGIVETVIDGATGFLAPRDVHAFSERIRLLLDSPEAVRVAANAASIVREQWSWTVSVGKLERLLMEAAGK